MKKPSAPIITIALTCIALTSCLKDKGTVKNTGSKTIPLTAAAITGQWSVVSDSASTSFWGIWGGKPPVNNTYIGQPGDYYRFTSGGVMYSSLNNGRDTEYYKISGDTILFRYAIYDVNMKLDSDYKQGFIVSNFTSSSCTLYSFILTPETAGSATIKIKR